ncbi:MAG: hypothetical protein ACI89J_002110 [Hyphomicrobiaceae bacterium]|jgi:hypothetical protein
MLERPLSIDVRRLNILRTAVDMQRKLPSAESVPSLSDWPYEMTAPPSVSRHCLNDVERSAKLSKN